MCKIGFRRVVDIVMCHIGSIDRRKRRFSYELAMKDALPSLELCLPGAMEDKRGTALAFILTHSIAPNQDNSVTF